MANAASRVRVQRHRGVGNDGLFQAGYDKAAKEAEEELGRRIESLERELRQRYDRESDTMARREQLLRDQLKVSEDQVKALEDALANLQGCTTMEGLRSLNAEKEQMRQNEVAAVAAGHGSRDGQDGISSTTFMGWPIYEISQSCKLILGGKDGYGPFEGGKAHGFARSVRDLYEMLLNTGRVGTIVTDPISYRGTVGVFVKGGTARDAAAASQVFDRS